MGRETLSGRFCAGLKKPDLRANGTGNAIGPVLRPGLRSPLHGRAERTRVFSRFAAEKEIHTNRRYETNTTDYPADAFRRRGIRPEGRRHSHGRRRRHRGERRRSGADAHACENPGEETVFHLGLQGRGVYSVARLRRIFAFGGFPGL